jgi:hypothetical protein
MQRGQDAIIPISTGTSNAIDLFNLTLVGFIMHASWTAASIAFKVAQVDDAFSGDNTYRDLYSNNTLIVIPASASQYITFDQDTIAKFRGVRHLKFISWDTGGGAVVNQDAARTIIPMVDELF